MDNSIVVNFRRERTYLEFQAAQEGLGQPKPDRFISMGAIMMTHVPDIGRFIFLNGESYKVMDQAWSVHIPDDPNKPNFHDPEVLLTLVQENNFTNGLAPTEDFRV